MNQELLDQLLKISQEEQKLLEGRKEIAFIIYMHNRSREIDSQLLLEEGKLISVRPQEVMLHFLRNIEEHYRDGQLSLIANELHYDPSWLSREIKRKSGKSLTELMQVKLLNQVFFLMKTTHMKVSEISENVGYENLSYFHSIFHHYFKTSPKKCRSRI